MDFGSAVISYFRKYATFNGRSSRSEYWYDYLFCAILGLAAIVSDFSLTIQILIVDSTVDAPIFFLSSLIGLVLFFPNIAIAVRRLHDTNRSGWWLLIVFIPLVGAIALIVFLCQRGTAGTNRFGDDPLAAGQITTPIPA